MFKFWQDSAQLESQNQNRRVFVQEFEVLIQHSEVEISKLEIQNHKEHSSTAKGFGCQEAESKFDTQQVKFELEQSKAWLQKLELENRQSKEEIEKLLLELRVLKEANAALLRSTSWRITWPLRKMMTMVRKIWSVSLPSTVWPEVTSRNRIFGVWSKSENCTLEFGPRVAKLESVESNLEFQEIAVNSHKLEDGAENQIGYLTPEANQIFNKLVNIKKSQSRH